MDTSREEFIQAWGLNGYDQDSIQPELYDLITPYANPGKVALEIGCGRGTWTRVLSQLFGGVVALDVIPPSDWIRALWNVQHNQVPDRCFECWLVEDNSIDFAFSFGCLCHLSETAVRSYLKSLYAKMKSGATAILMFGNWTRHPGPDTSPGGLCPWFYQDLPLVKSWAAEAGFVDFKDLLPSHRDTLARMVKR